MKLNRMKESLIFHRWVGMRDWGEYCSIQHRLKHWFKWTIGRRCANVSLFFLFFISSFAFCIFLFVLFFFCYSLKNKIKPKGGWNINKEERRHTWEGREWGKGKGKGSYRYIIGDVKSRKMKCVTSRDLDSAFDVRRTKLNLWNERTELK